MSKTISKRTTLSTKSSISTWGSHLSHATSGAYAGEAVLGQKREHVNERPVG